MLTSAQIARYHAHVHVWCWPVLWYYLLRLAAAIEHYGREGRAFSCGVERNGVIWIDWVSDSAAERRARGALPHGFDRTPWERLAAAPLIELFRALGIGSGHDTLMIPPRYRGETALIPSARPAPALHPP